MAYNKYLNAKPNSKPWGFSIVLSVAMIVSFFLPWWGASASGGGFSFSNSTSPMDYFEQFYIYLIYSFLCLVFAYKRWWFALLPALLNLTLATNAIGLFGKGYSASYSGYSASSG